MSSMRNAVQRRNHKERAQPVERQKWGLLEKHKDYSKRAADHNAKKRKLKALQTKASERNEDEFYFGMLGSTSNNGVKRARREGPDNGGAHVLNAETVKLMKTQDVGYLRTVLQSTRQERARVEEDVVLAATGVRRFPPAETGMRIVFSDQDEGPTATPARSPRQSDGPNIAGGVDVLDADEDDALGDLISTSKELELGRRRQHDLEVKERKLEALKERETRLSIALREVTDQRERMNGKAGGVNKAGVRFKARQRQR